MAGLYECVNIFSVNNRAKQSFLAAWFTNQEAKEKKLISASISVCLKEHFSVILIETLQTGKVLGKKTLLLEGFENLLFTTIDMSS